MKAASFVAAFASALVAMGIAFYFIPVKPNPQTVQSAAEEMTADIDINGPHAVAVVEEPGGTYNFGTMVLGDTDEHTFVIRNDGDRPLKLKKLFNTCKCTLSNLEEAVVEPGETLDVVLTYTPKNAEPEFSQGAKIGTNDPGNNPLDLVITGEVLRDVIVLPTDVWNIGPISEDADSPTKASGVIVSGYQDDFEVVEMVPGHPAIEAEISEKISPEELEESGGKSGSIITITVRPEIPVGRFSFPVRFKTNSTREESKEVVVTIGGTRSGPFSILGQGWIGANSRLALGRIKAGEGKSQKLTMFVDKVEQPLEMEVIEVSPPIADVKFERDDTYENENREKATLTVTVKPDISPGLYEDAEDRVKVRLKSNHPRFQEFNFEISFRAE